MAVPALGAGESTLRSPDSERELRTNVIGMTHVLRGRSPVRCAIHAPMLGRDADILVGRSAPVVAYVCFVRRRWLGRPGVWWTPAGIPILLSVVVQVLLAAPTSFRVLLIALPIIFVGHVPYIAFRVPLAWPLHAVSQRQLRSAR
jgi:hypothetical protein